ncbi:ubiquinone/menaquinone biosynthesis C-methylase UbiE [Marmoricola sp. URHA0025 HA25]
MTMPGVRDAYDRSAASWRRGPEAVYAHLAEALISVTPVDLDGASVLDVGAGTAVAARAALEHGAGSAVATDIAAEMLRGRPPGVAGVLADGSQLPFRDDTFDLVTAAFCLGHMADPAAAVREIRRVGGAVVASAFPPGPAHPVKAAVDRAFALVGFSAPAWYQRQKDELEPQVDDPTALAELARRAGFERVEVHRLDVDTGISSAAEAVEWRLGMAHLAPFVSGLAPDLLAHAWAEAEKLVAPFLPVVIPMIALSAA